MARWKCHFSVEIPLYVFVVCAYVCLRVMLERQKSDYRLTFDFFSHPPLPPPGAMAEMQSHNNGWLFLPGKRWGSCGRGVGRGAGGVYLSHGNWFAGVEVGSFEKTSFSLTPSHLSVWKAAGRKGRRIERGREGVSEGVLLQRHFHTKAGESEWVCLKAQSDASLKWRIRFLHPAK